MVEAGFPPGVINILPGAGSNIGQRMADHPDIRKLGFTGSTPIGKQIMKRWVNTATLYGWLSPPIESRPVFERAIVYSKPRDISQSSITKLCDVTDIF